MSMNVFLKVLLYLTQNIKRFIDNYKRKMILEKFSHVGNNFVFDLKSIFIRPETITIGNNVFIGPNSHISSRDLTFGNDIMIGPNLLIECDDHKFDVIGVKMKHISEQRNIGKIIKSKLLHI